MQGQEKYNPIKSHEKQIRPKSIADTSAEELAVCVQKGSRESFAELINRYGGRLLILMQYKTGNIIDAEDLVQETFVRAFTNIQKYQSSFPFSTWLFTIASRLASNHHRKLKLHGNVEQQEKTDNNNPLNVASERESRTALWSLAGRLAPSQYQVLWLKYAEGMSIKEIAKVTGNSQINVKVLLYRARMNLARQIKDSKSDDKK